MTAHARPDHFAWMMDEAKAFDHCAESLDAAVRALPAEAEELGAQIGTIYGRLRGLAQMRRVHYARATAERAKATVRNPP